ncbi:Zinc finger MYM-type 1-like protein [Oopsacas minuta]|uniref:Zinc finger MYM-type 1-like protein n=1 Tax=Oopsacas minuta TaxID=111878 RepID=A0AAV7JI37_9METZ|nr:Zinc finger MYM-type 1-like protein [Oopsacas minuta]
MVDKDIEEPTRFYNGDVLELPQLRWERQAWFNRCDIEGLEISWQTLKKKLKVEPGMKVMLPGLHTALVLYLVLPVTTCEAERSFSVLWMLLTYFRSTKGQERMSSLAFLNSHWDLVRTILPIEDLMQEFIKRSTVRLNMFEQEKTIIHERRK